MTCATIAAHVMERSSACISATSGQGRLITSVQTAGVEQRGEYAVPSTEPLQSWTRVRQLMRAFNDSAAA